MTAAAARFTDPFLREYFLDSAYDEMFTPQGEIRAQYALLLETFPSHKRSCCAARIQRTSVF